jgi:ethanolaminephosphotransferase
MYLANTASDYNISMMIGGVLFISLSAVGFILWSFQLANKTHCIWNFSKFFSVFAILAYSVSMFASSFVEEEHKTWYYIVQTTFMLLAVHG